MARPIMITVLASILLSIGSGPAGAGWIENGITLTHQFSVQWNDWQTTSDGAGGVIAAFYVCDDNKYRIVAQRVDSLGNVLWGEIGADISSAPGDKRNPQLTSDGAGGAIITWQDFRGDDTDVYAQRVDASGIVQWTIDGVAVCAAAGGQGGPRIVSDGAGGAIVTWQDFRNGNADIFAQKVNASGTTQWAAGGVAVCTAIGTQQRHQTSSDGEGGAVLVWSDNRSGIRYEVYTQRISGSGTVLWQPDGVLLCSVFDVPRGTAIIGDGTGGAIVTWEEFRNGNNDIWAQRVDASGAVQWAANGIGVCADLDDQHDPQLTSDGAGGAIVTWSDYRNGNLDLFAQRIDASGIAQWTADGIAVCTEPEYQEDPQLTSDGAGGAIITWINWGAGDTDIYSQRVDASGSILWAAGGIAICTAPGSRSIPRIIPDGRNGAFITWLDGRDGGINAYSQRVDSLGAVQWETDGAKFFSSGRAARQMSPGIVSDGSGNAIVTWNEYVDGAYEIYAQRFDASGTILWSEDGSAICVAERSHNNPAIIADGANGAIIAWNESSGGEIDIYCQKVDVSGAIQWGAEGVALCTVPGTQSGHSITSDGAGGAIVTWRDQRSPGAGIYAQRVDAAGAVQWAADGVVICSMSGYGGAVADGAGGAFIAWTDYRNGYYDIFAQKVDASGTVQWAANGVPVCTFEVEKMYAFIIPDGAGGAIVSWHDMRNGDWDIFAQRLDGSGTALWDTAGVALCTAPGDQWGYIIPDGAGGAIAAWYDDRTGDYDIYAQKVNASGTVQWAADGVALCTAPEPQTQAAVISDGAGGAIVAWWDQRPYPSIYAQRVDASGATRWETDGVAVSTEGRNAGSLTIAPDDAGGAFIAWVNDKCTQQIFAQRILASGEITATLLQSYSAALLSELIRIAWTVSEIDEGARFSVSRASGPGWVFSALDEASIVRDGLSFTFSDETCLPGSAYKYRVYCESGETASKMLFETEVITMPEVPATLYQNYPNPFNPKTVIRFYLPQDTETNLDVYDVMGRRVATLVDGARKKGYHTEVWDGRNSSGSTCASGIYFLRLRAGRLSTSRKIVLMR